MSLFNFQRAAGLWLSCLVLAAIGCSDSDLGRVTGTVHLDGEPLPEALVTFYPETEKNEGGSGAASYGRTDESGKYELQYNRDQKGAEIGSHKVVITTLQEGGGGDYGAGVKERVPNKYNQDTELIVEVQGGSNVIDFLELDSKGKITQGRGY